MIRLGLRLTLAGGRDAAARLAIIAAAVALGVGLLLSTLAALNATTTQNSRYAWLNTGAAATPASSSADPLWWLLRADTFNGKVIARIDIAATGPHAPVPPGIPFLPAPGQFYASPALGKLMATTPAAELADRYPGHQVGTIGNSALPGPNSLVIVIGNRPDELANNRQAHQVTSILATPPSQCSDCVVGTKANGVDLILSVVAVALIFPVVILIGTATRLSATRREQRFAAMRLVGATPKQISMISAVESTVAAVVGMVAGLGVFFLIRPVMSATSFTPDRFFTSDLSLSPANLLLVVVGVPVAAALSARIALRRVQISPLGVTRKVTPRPPRAYRVIPLAAGIAELAYFVGRDPKTTTGQIQAFVPGILLVLGGLVIAGPWLTMAGARLMASHARRPALLVAGRRLSDDPRAGFRAVSGLILALCITSGAVGIITSLVAERHLPKGSEAVSTSLVDDFTHGLSPDRQPIGALAPLTDTALAQLRAIPGIQGVTEIRTNPLGTIDPSEGKLPPGVKPWVAGLASCAQLASTPAFSVCPAGAEAASVAPHFENIGFDPGDWPALWPAAAISAEQLQSLPVQEIVVATDGSVTATEQARTALANAYPTERPPTTISEERNWQYSELALYQRLADVVIVVSFPIAGCSLAVSVAGGLSDRKRPFSLLRLTGVRLGVLRRIVLLESAVPLLVVSVVAIGMGFLSAQLFLQAQFGYSVRAPGVEYYVITTLGLAASLGVIASTLPLLRRITGPEVARND
ncbi:ABC-type lipoprotein release transport system permease subunit [Kitasatospora sp. MAP12-15]|uniref:FtsX-like permease family protein n=1 Tax=unclassified Kitasatospora TaxID=2633591 RepID=UPI002476F632|nr:FtsX-like permease family protein [Kitasatospora sp. MAP12-44]MDH6109961.1 ABC-type lipoprotein release transport system permease subunit [Kitasatospora sp. MAP12-44]